MKALAFSLCLAWASAVLATVTYSNAVDITSRATNIELTAIDHVMVPTKYEVRQISGCVPDGDPDSIHCVGTAVVEARPVIRVTVSYDHPESGGANFQPRFPSERLNFRIEEFSAAEVARIQAHSGDSAQLARKLLRLQVLDLERTLKVIDYENSDFCLSDDVLVPQPIPGRTPWIVYKTSTYPVKEVTVAKKK
jgi:hypothetical protein